MLLCLEADSLRWVTPETNPDVKIWSHSVSGGQWFWHRLTGAQLYIHLLLGQHCPGYLGHYPSAQAHQRRCCPRVLIESGSSFAPRPWLWEMVLLRISVASILLWGETGKAQPWLSHFDVVSLWPPSSLLLQLSPALCCLRPGINLGWFRKPCWRGK